MNIESAESSFQNVKYRSDQYKKLMEHIGQQTNSSDVQHICLMSGEPKKPKQKALKQIADRTGLDIKTVDANDLITKIESETFSNIDYIFSHFNPDEELMYITDGDRLSGSYTGYTNSKVKYATPQERYFLKKVQEKGGFYVVDIFNTFDSDTTLHRASQSFIRFPIPTSFFKKIMWNLRHITVNGTQIKTRRPNRYDTQTTEA